MPVLLIWAAPGVIALGVTGYYFVVVADLVDAALGLGMPTKARPRQPRCALTPWIASTSPSSRQRCCFSSSPLVCT
jgi:hypothetical protein